MFERLNEVILNTIISNIREGNVNACRALGFSQAELQKIQNLSIDEIFDIAKSKVPIAKIDIDHSAFWTLINVAQSNSQERMIIDRALTLGASIKMLNTYFGLSTTKVSSRRNLLGIKEEIGRKTAATDDEKTILWELWQENKDKVVQLESVAGLELLILFSEETETNLTAVWTVIEQWYRNKQ
ncbi:DUF2857 domain-containing protein [Phocoenobacter skyensis]|uniref:DUF2857 domain-containing protein n=1 Tax=Phocoenobacter skyensis TaxID=97481 RepID=UPI00276FECB5|nr:DUF2857 domain-containing protein [Pasteurella skyensis]MDP8185282.1 DUF2857 domain-containing protein [Pasteurella skyensis]